MLCPHVSLMSVPAGLHSVTSVANQTSSLLNSAALSSVCIKRSG
jgi:hypothetical protein